MQDVGAGVDTEDVVVEIDVGAGFAVEGLNLDLHDQDSCAPSVAAVSTTVSSTGVSTGASAGASLVLAALFRPAGSGASGWRGSLTASRTSSQPPFEPGTEPLTKRRPRSASVRTISRCCWGRLEGKS